MRVASSVLFFSIAFVSTGQSLVGNGRPHACVAERSSNTSQSQESAQDDEKTLGSIFAKIMEAGSDPEPKVPLDESEEGLV